MKAVPENHPVCQMFRVLTERAMHQAQLEDSQVVMYVSRLLLHFLYTENLHPFVDGSGAKTTYVTDLIQMAEQSDVREKQRIYQHVGDYALFILGVYPESLDRPRRCLDPTFYASQGRRSYIAASELLLNAEATQLCRKMADQFERCVLGLNWFKEFTSDPFYQYMFREFGVG